MLHSLVHRRRDSGWIIKSYPIDSPYWRVTELAVGERPASSSSEATAPSATSVSGGSARRQGNGGITVSPGTRPGFVEVRFPDRPSEDVLASLRSRGFRWARGRR